MARTACEMTRDEWLNYAPLSIRPENSVTISASATKKEALQVARHAAKILRELFSAKTVYLFGSLAAETGFTEYSDIDLAATGIPADSFCRAVAAVTGLSQKYSVDLVDPETCKASVKQSIMRQGVEI